MKHCQEFLSPAQSLLAIFTATTRCGPRIPNRTLLRPQARSVYRGVRATNPLYQRQATPEIVNRLAEFTKDEEIQAYQVKVRGPEDENGRAKLSEPQLLRHLLRDIDRETQCVVQISKPGTTEYPVVQISNKDDLRKQVRDKEKRIKLQQQESKASKPKQIEMNWAIDIHDLGIKLKQLENFLEKGKKVEILLAAKRRGRKAELAEGLALLKDIRQKLLEIDAKEIKTMQGEVLKQATLTVQRTGEGG